MSEKTPQIRRFVAAAAALAAMLAAACGTIVGNPKRPGGSSSTPPAASVVDDPQAQAQAVTLDINGVVALVSDGTTASDSISSYGLTLTDGDANALLGASFHESRSCTAVPVATATPVTGADGTTTWQVPATAAEATITRSLTGQLGSKTYTANADGSPSSTNETWFPGPYYGLANATPIAGSNAAVMPTTGSTPPPIPSPLSGSPAGSSGLVGSVGWRSIDGSWTGAPVWQVGTGYLGEGAATATATTGMVMYNSANLPVIAAAATAPKIGGAFAPLAMVNAKTGKASPYSVLGQRANGVLPSFQPTGAALVGGVKTPVGEAGTVSTGALPAVMYNPQTKIFCADAANVGPGWRFSQNVAGLTRATVTKSTYQLAYKNGTAAATTSGTSLTTWSDPALVAPVSAAPSAPYFDENAGTMTLTRIVAVGAAASPNTSTSVYTSASGVANPEIVNLSYSAAPFVDTMTRDINNGFAWISRTIHQGTLTSSHASGGAAPAATISTAFTNVVFTNVGDPIQSCVPSAGVIVATIAPADATLQTTTITLNFGTNAGIPTASGVTISVGCTGGAAGASNCHVLGETDDADYRPSGCNF